MTTMAGNISSSKPGITGSTITFDGITLTELDTNTLKLMPETARTIYRGTAVALVEGPHLYKLNGYYYLFAARAAPCLPTGRWWRGRKPSRPTASKPSRATCS